MRHTIFGTAIIGILSVSCARSVETGASAPTRVERAREARVHAPPTQHHEVSSSGGVTSRRVGDFAVHMVTGNFRKQPALLTERVVGDEGGAWILEYTLEDGEGATSLRVWTDRETGQVTRVARLADGIEKPGTVADYEALMASASVVPDTNEGLLSDSNGTCTVGPNELDCQTKNYRVMLGEREAILGVTRSAELPGADLSGEITGTDGSVIFRSELIERGNEAENANDSFALR